MTFSYAMGRPSLHFVKNSDGELLRQAARELRINIILGLPHNSLKRGGLSLAAASPVRRPLRSSATVQEA
jgi:hypothetical protein